MLKRVGKCGLAVVLLYLGMMFGAARVHWNAYERALPLSITDSTSPFEFASLEEYGGPTIAVADRQSDARARSSVTGALHVHTERSHDAEGTLAEVARAARTSGLDFVLLSDHNVRGAEQDEPDWPRYLDDVLVIDGREITFGADVGRVLTFGLDTTLTRWQGSVDDFAALLARRRGSAIVAHARSPAQREAWHHGSAPGIAGWEAFDMSDIARYRITTLSGPYHLLSLISGLPLGFADRSLVRLHRNGFRYPGAAGFDSLSLRQPITALAGSNAHPKTRIGGRILPGYEPFFRAFANHFVLDGELPADPLAARDSVAAALGEGRVFISFGDTGRARSFAMGVESGGRIRAGIGDAVFRQEGMVLRAELPGERTRRLEYRVVRNGETAARVRGRKLAWEIPRSGVYRVEVYRYTLAAGPLTWNRRPWIFSNPVHLLRPEAPLAEADAAL